MDLLDSISYVKRGKNRQKVFMVMERHMLPSEIVKTLYGKSSNTYFNIVSRSLGELASKKLVSVHNPKEKTGRLYKLTKHGKEVKDLLEK